MPELTSGDRSGLPRLRAAPAPAWRRWAPSARGPYALVETCLGMAGMIALCAWLRPQDPLLAQMQFPWLSAFALIFALRYGALLGIVAGSCLLAAWWLFYAATAELPREPFVGLFVMLVLVGHFSDRWADRLAQGESVNQYLHDRLGSLINNHYLLRISHDRIEKELLSRPVTLRDSLGRLRASCVDPATPEPLPGIQAFLDYTAKITQINEAAVFVARSDGFSAGSAACIGQDFALQPQDPLLQKCLESGEPSHVRELGDERSHYLACIPIRTAPGETLGILVIRRMSFLALNHDTLQLILVLLAYYADGLRQQPAIAAIQRAVPDCPDDFALELARLTHLTACGGPSSHLVALVFPKEGTNPAIHAQLARGKRGLDLTWALETPQSHILVNLLALTGDTGAEGYIARTRETLQSHFGIDLDASPITIHDQKVGRGDAGGTLARFKGLLEPS